MPTKVEVTMVICVSGVGSWSDESTMTQIREQASRRALEKLTQKIGQTSEFVIIETPKVHVVITDA